MLARNSIEYSIPWSLDRPRHKCEDCGIEELHARPTERGKRRQLIIAVHECVGCGRFVCKRCLFRHQDFFRHLDHRESIEQIPPPIKRATRNSVQLNRDHIDRIRDSADIVRIVSRYVALRQVGHVYWGLCPFHQEKSPSFKVQAQPPRFHCFGCNESGDVFAFVMKKEALSFPEAVRRLGGE